MFFCVQGRLIAMHSLLLKVVFSCDVFNNIISETQIIIISRPISVRILVPGGTTKNATNN